MNRIEREKMLHRDEVEAICPVCGDESCLRGSVIECQYHGDYDAHTLKKIENADFGHYHGLSQYKNL